MSAALLYGANVFANGIRQHYLRYGGKGRPIILIPGITSPAITWGFVAERLAERYDVYVLDVRGRGLSSTGPDLDYGLDAMAADVIGFAQGSRACRPCPSRPLHGRPHRHTRIDFRQGRSFRVSLLSTLPSPDRAAGPIPASCRGMSTPSALRSRASMPRA